MKDFSERIRVKIASSVFLFAFLFAPVSVPAFSKGGDVDAFLENLLRDDYHISYETQEVAIFFSKGEPDVYRYKVGVLRPDKMRREKYSIHGTVEEVMTHDGELQIIYNPSKRVVIRGPAVKEKRSDESIRELISLIKKNYNIKFLGNAVISGRNSLAFSIEPRRQGTRPGFRVWVDHETALPLKTEIYSVNGEMSYLSTLSHIVINPSFPQDYFVIMVPHGTMAYEVSVPSNSPSISKIARVKKGYPERIPGGYVLKEEREDKKGQIQLIYHDGLNSISIFSYEWDQKKMGNIGKIKEGKGNALEKIAFNGFEGYFCRRDNENLMSFISGRRRYTVVGKASKEGLIEIAVELKGRGLKR